MKVPNRKTASFVVCQALYKLNHAVTIEEGVEIHGFTGIPKLYAAKVVYNKMCGLGFLVEVKGKYSVPENLKKWFADIEIQPKRKVFDLVPPRTPAPFKPMAVQKRDERLRDYSHLTVGV